ncbi:MAG: dsbA [Hyphomonadaceae bacterium]|nr:MAG: dsbA [Hyphomonadaceae bacterium]KAF0185497.1 MAG: dsbA [Hyphomonadaceae bacterium]
MYSKRKLHLATMLALLAFSGLAWGDGVAPKATTPQVSEAFVGQANAPVTLIEYGSLTCGHCAAFQNDVYPSIKTRYIDTGKVRYIFRSLPTAPASLSVGLQVIADCAGGHRRYAIIDAFFAQQPELMEAAGQQGGALNMALAIARRAGGLSETAARACVAEQSRAQAIFDIAQAGTAQFQLDHTPTLIINGEKFEPADDSEYTVANVSAALDNAYRLATTPTTRRKKK